MRKILIVLVSVAILATSQGAAFARPKLALNPSSQMENPGAIKGYREGTGAKDIANRAYEYARRQGFPTRIFWSGKAHDISREINSANKFNAGGLISIHSDGIPKSRGILVLYATPKAKNMGAVVGSYIASKMNLKFEGLSYRPELTALRRSKAPAILIEYLSHANLQDNRKLNDPDFRQQLAEATVQGYMKYWNYRIHSSRKSIKTTKPVVKQQLKPVAPNTVDKKSMNVMKINPVKTKVSPKLNKATKPGIGSAKKVNGNEMEDSIMKKPDDLLKDAERSESPIKSLVKLTVGYFKVTLGLGGIFD